MLSRPTFTKPEWTTQDAHNKCMSNTLVEAKHIENIIIETDSEVNGPILAAKFRMEILSKVEILSNRYDEK